MRNSFTKEQLKQMLIKSGQLGKHNSNKNNISSYDKFEYKSIIKETAKAWLLKMNGGASLWIPKSQCKVDDEYIYIPKWLTEKMIIEFATKSINNERSKSWQRKSKSLKNN